MAACAKAVLEWVLEKQGLCWLSVWFSSHSHQSHSVDRSRVTPALLTCEAVDVTPGERSLRPLGLKRQDIRASQNAAQLYSDGHPEENVSECLCCGFPVHAGGRCNSSALPLHHKSASKVPGVQAVLKVVPLISNGVALLQIKNLGHTVQWPVDLVPLHRGKFFCHMLNIWGQLLPSFAHLLYHWMSFFSYYLGTRGEIWPWTKSQNKDYVTVMIKWDFCINVNFILCGFLPRGKSDPQA